MTFVSGETVSDLILRMLVGPSMCPGWHRGVEGSRASAKAPADAFVQGPADLSAGRFLLRPLWWPQWAQ